jgi:hypothetical protein
MDSRPAGSATLSRVPHPGITRVGDRLVMSSVEIVESPVLYDKPVDGYDRSQPAMGSTVLVVAVGRSWLSPPKRRCLLVYSVMAASRWW